MSEAADTENASNHGVVASTSPMTKGKIAEFSRPG